MNRALFTCAALLMLTGCGIKRPLIAPKDIPAFEEKTRKKRERILEEQEAVDKANEQTPVEQKN